MRKRSRPDFNFYEPPPATTRRCDHPNCDRLGEYRAPKSPHSLHEYYWFCLEHVRVYNETWDFYRGMNDVDIEASRRDDVTWNRPTWKLGESKSFRPIFANEQAFRERIYRSFFRQSTRQQPPTPTLSEALHVALSTLGLAFPVDFKTIKAHYKKLAKQYHPDLHGHDTVAEERLKDINHAYSILKQHESLFPPPTSQRPQP